MKRLLRTLGAAMMFAGILAGCLAVLLLVMLMVMARYGKDRTQVHRLRGLVAAEVL